MTEPRDQAAPKPGANTTASGSPRSVEDPGVVREIQEYRQALQRRERPDRNALLARYPDLAEELGRCLDALEAFERVFPNEPRDGGGNPHSPGAGGPERGVVGDFRIIRQIGRGGMGVVYEAEQVSLGRRVALKILPFAAVLDPRHLRRFQNEARAAASLEHPNIVGIYSVGCERGVYYYAMQYIEGQTLAEVIAELRVAGPWSPDPGQARTKPPHGRDVSEPPISCEDYPANPAALEAAGDAPVAVERRRSNKSARMRRSCLSSDGSTHGRDFFRAVARLGIQAAEALEHAHQLGIVHRDIKPSNLLFDHEGRLWVTDFGLAMSNTGPDLTMTGDVVGTLRYMSPEQVEGNRQVLDHHTDIYSLGATLYELLTLRPAFEGDSRERLVRDVLANDAPAPRSVNPSIPKDLETIILKAMAKDPQARYATAQEMADDLRRFLNGEPIRAKRPGPIERISKWSRRHKPLVGGLLSLLTVIGIAGPLVAINQVRLRAEADGHAARADANLKMALRAVDEMYTQLNEETLTDAPASDPMRAAFLNRAAAFYSEFTRLNETNETVAVETATGHFRLAMMHFWQSRFSESEWEFDRALARFERLAKRGFEDPRSSVAQAHFLCEKGFLYYRWGRFPDAEATYRLAISKFEALAERHTEDADIGVLLESDAYLAHTRDNLGGLLLGMGRITEAEREARTALAGIDAVVAKSPANPLYRWFRSISRQNLSSILARSARLEEADKYNRAAIAEKEELLVAAPRSGQFRFQLAYSHICYAALLGQTARVRESEEQAHRAIHVCRSLIQDSPEREEYFRISWDAMLWTYSLHRKTADLAGMRTTVVTARELFQASRAPDRHTRMYLLLLEYEKDLAARKELEELAQVRRERGTFAAALRDSLRTVPLSADPLSADVRNRVAWSLVVDRGTETELAGTGVLLAESAVSLSPRLGKYWNTLGAARCRAGDWTGAKEALAKSLELDAETPCYDWLYLAMADWHLGNKEEGRYWFEKAVDWMGKNDIQDPYGNLGRLRAEAAELQGIAEKPMGKDKEAAKSQPPQKPAPPKDQAKPAGKPV